MDTNARIKVLYVLGPAYSGSTLFGLALGQHQRVLNLGEAVNLHHDYHALARCTCGSQLQDCEFWQAVRAGLQQSVDRGECPAAGQLSDDGGRSAIDRRGGLVKLLYSLCSPSSLFRPAVIHEYRAVSRALFRAAADVGGVDYLVDLSKSPERLQLLQSEPAVDLWCVFLDRDQAAVYASTMARPKRTRARFGFKALRESFWLAYRRWHMNRVYRAIAPERRLRIDIAAFETDPGRVLQSLAAWLGLPPFEHPGGDAQRLIALDKQHVYVGNRWLFDNDRREVTIASGTSPRALSRTQRLAFRLFNR